MPPPDPTRPLVHPLPDLDRVERQADLVYAAAAGRELAMDVYRPADRPRAERVPAVLLVHGEVDPALLRGVRGWGQFTGWGRLLAGAGLAGVAFEHRAIAEAGPEAVVGEVLAALDGVRQRAGELGLDPDRLAFAGFSAGAPLAGLALARAPERLRCAALCYGPLDRLDPVPGWPPLLVVRAGRDRPELNRTIDRFVATATDRGLPVELVHQPDGHHAFDIVDDTDASRAAIGRVLAFLRDHLGG
jgi:acetyl esterase/lipase